MTEKQFIRSLERRLRWQMPVAEKHNILKEYRDYFQYERNSGVREEELVAGCGDVQLIVDEILSQRLFVSHLPKRIICAILFWGIVYFVVYSCTSTSGSERFFFNLVWQSIAMLAVGVLSGKVLGGKSVLVHHHLSRRCVWFLYAINGVFLILLSVVLLWLLDLPLIQIFQDAKNGYPSEAVYWFSSIPPGQVGAIVRTIVQTIMVLSMLFCIGSCVLAVSYDGLLLPLCIMNFSMGIHAAAYLMCVGSLNLDREWMGQMPEALLNLKAVMGIGIILSIVGLLICQRIGRTRS